MLAAPTLVFALLYLPYLALGGTVQQPGLVVPTDYQQYKDRVKTMFTESYGAYK
jgi:mannosyl-oligosaccharide alpha-1,2-mannosidase